MRRKSRHMKEPPSAVVLDAMSLEVRVKYKVKGRMEAVDRGGSRVVDFMALLKQVHRTSQSPDRSKFQSFPFFYVCVCFGGSPWELYEISQADLGFLENLGSHPNNHEALTSDVCREPQEPSLCSSSCPFPEQSL